MGNCTQIGSLNQRNLKKKEKEKTNMKQKTDVLLQPLC